MQGGLVSDCIAMQNMGHFSLLQGHLWIEIFFMICFGISVFSR